MQKFVDVVIPMNLKVQEKYNVAIGDLPTVFEESPWSPFDSRILRFLSDISKFLLNDREARRLPDLVSFAYWCRPSNLDHIREQSGEIGDLIGRGSVLHIPPTNVPLNFAYSLVAGLLSGNTNIVRMPNLDSLEVQRVINAIEDLFLRSEHSEVAKRISVVQYGHEDEVTQYLSEQTDARVIWGGDKTVRHIRSIPTNPRSVDVSFADRISIALVKSSAVTAASSDGLNELARNFYVDGYTFNQNACSSPRLVVWNGTRDENDAAANKFWKAVAEVAIIRGEVEPVHIMNRLVETCESLTHNENILAVEGLYEPAMRLRLKDELLWEETSMLRFGTFSQRSISSLQELEGVLNPRVQTISYFGYTKPEFEHVEVRRIFQSVDRVVPFGQALTFELVWDGYDLIRTLSRRVVIR